MHILRSLRRGFLIIDRIEILRELFPDQVASFQKRFPELFTSIF